MDKFISINEHTVLYNTNYNQHTDVVSIHSFVISWILEVNGTQKMYCVCNE